MIFIFILDAMSFHWLSGDHNEEIWYGPLVVWAFNTR